MVAMCDTSRCCGTSRWLTLVECCFRSRDERRKRGVHMVWRNTEVWTSERSKALADV